MYKYGKENLKYTKLKFQNFIYLSSYKRRVHDEPLTGPQGTQFKGLVLVEKVTLSPYIVT